MADTARTHGSPLKDLTVGKRNTLNVHTVFIIKNADGTISVYNDNNGCVTTTTYKSIEHYIQSGEYTPIVYYEIS